MRERGGEEQGEVQHQGAERGEPPCVHEHAGGAAGESLEHVRPEGPQQRVADLQHAEQHVHLHHLLSADDVVEGGYVLERDPPAGGHDHGHPQGVHLRTADKATESGRRPSRQATNVDDVRHGRCEKVAEGGGRVG